MVNHRAVANIAAQPQIALDQGGQTAQGITMIKFTGWYSVHRDIAMGMRLDPPLGRGRRRLRQEAQRSRMIRDIGALQACAADHDVEIMGTDIIPDALPQ